LFARNCSPGKSGADHVNDFVADPMQYCMAVEVVQKYRSSWREFCAYTFSRGAHYFKSPPEHRRTQIAAQPQHWWLTTDQLCARNFQEFRSAVSATEHWNNYKNIWSKACATRKGHHAHLFGSVLTFDVAGLVFVHKKCRMCGVWRLICQVQT